ncbi:MAG: hypothetical protein AAGL10_00350 [Pseudomonadota bacterium]
MPLLDPRRLELCGPVHAARVALRLCEDTEYDHVVIQTAEPLQPYRVCRLGETESENIALQIIVL